MSLLNFLFPNRAKRSHLKNLIAVAMSDESMDPAEAQVLNDIARRLGVSDAEVREIIGEYKGIRFVLPETNAERVDLLWDYVCLIVADGRIEDRELRLFELFCQKIRLRTGVISSLMRRFGEWGKTGLSLEYFRQDFRKLLSDSTVFQK